MSDVYRQLLDATILHLQQLKTQGVRFVPVSPETIADLNENPSAIPATGPAAPNAPKFSATPAR